MAVCPVDLMRKPATDSFSCCIIAKPICKNLQCSHIGIVFGEQGYVNRHCFYVASKAAQMPPPCLVQQDRGICCSGNPYRQSSQIAQG